ncbi:MAG TPA: DUF899 family protein, partial [Gammaproteobacteria bacterium]|nr:DUF899 family protein [Gammaproteobacteria bacterium]
AKPKARKAAPALSEQRFPNESPAYRRARDKLLQAEMDMRRMQEALAGARRKLPAGGALSEDYVFEESAEVVGVRKVKLSGLFAPGKDVLVLYSFMYGPAMERPCPSCTSILDALDGNAVAIGQRMNLAVVAKSSLPRILTFAKERGWRHLRFLSSAGNTYNRDYFGEGEDGKQWPMFNVFQKRGDKIHHSWGSELLFVKQEKGQNARHVDFMWPLWNVFDATPIGRGTDWYPKLSYPA